MRKLVLGMLLAAGATLPMIATAQDRPPEGRQRDGGERPHGEGRPQQQRQAAGQQNQQASPQVQAQVQVEARARGDDPRRGDQGNRPPNSRGGDGGQRRFSDGDRQLGYRTQGATQIAPGSGGYRAQGDTQVAPGSRRYQQQNGFQGGPGSGSYRAQGGPQFAPGAGDYRSQSGFRREAGNGGYQSQNGYRGGGYDRGGYRAGGPDRGRGGAWNRGWRGDQRFDWGRYRNQNRSAFRLQRYYAPGGWNYGYRRFSVGFTLNSVLFAQNYWIEDPYDYRLPPAYGPYRWVRYYNDALLVDIRTGYVVDVVNDIFW